MGKLLKVFTAIIIILSSFLPFFLFSQTHRIIVVYNNLPYKKGLITDWGISCVIEGYTYKILFDTGSDGSILLQNLKKLGIAPQDIKVIFITHLHADHIGGLISFLQRNGKVTVYLPAISPPSFVEKVSTLAQKVIKVSGPLKIMDGVWSTGLLGKGIKEQSLVMDCDKGLVILTGCAHPGIVNIVEYVKDRFHKNIYMLLGGFHLLSASEREVKEIVSQLKRLGVAKVGPSHCTGDKAIIFFKNKWRDDFLNFGCGAEIKF
ncbi:MBL fold metallo-hydrolase [Candidatus Calescamantes bacterium]|nr:MBL fold metallo-hydrolase [Candidatus Calescamantes bacterium]